MNFIINLIPQNAQLKKRPEKSDMLAYGAYMTNASGCIECHTQVEKGQIIPDKAFAGGREFILPDGSIVRSANITADAATGLGKWNDEMFVKRFKIYADSNYVSPTVQAGEFNTVMPWTMYAGMDEYDLKSIYAYIKSQPAIANNVIKFTAN